MFRSLRFIWPTFGSLRNTNRNVLCLKKCVHPFDTEFASPAALLDAAKWCLGGRRQTVIDANNAGFERFSEAEHAAEIACESIRAKAIWGIVRSLDGLGFRIKRGNRRNRRKRLFLHAQCAQWCVRKNRWLEKISRA